MELHAGNFQAVHPAAQQRRGLAIGGEHPARTAHEGVDAQPARPCAQSIGIEAVQPCCDVIGALTVAAIKVRTRLGMGEIQATSAGDQEFAANRSLGFE